MRVTVLVTVSVLLVLAAVLLVDSGRIVRTWRRRGHGGHGPVSRRQSSWSPLQYWSRYFQARRAPRIIRRHHVPKPLLPQSHHPAVPRHRATQLGRSKVLSPWRPLDFGNPITRDPTYDYAPPTSDQVKFVEEGRGRRREGSGHPPPRRWRPRPYPPTTTTSLWKMLTRRQRRPFRPRPPRPPPRLLHSSSEEAEVTQYLPNIVYFQNTDMVPSTTSTAAPTTETAPEDGMKPGFVSDVPLYPTQATSASEFEPVLGSFKPMPVGPGPSKDYIFRVISVEGLKKKPIYSKAAPAPTTAPPTSTEQSAPPPPPESTESLFELLQQPPAPINSFNINLDPGAEGSSGFFKVVRAEASTEAPPPTTTPEVPSSTTTEVHRPLFAVRVQMPEALPSDEPLEEVPEPVGVEPEVKSTTASTHRLPTMPPYKKRPVFPKAKPAPKPSRKDKTSKERASDSMLNSGESITITGIRSKVKEYKPQNLANYTQLLAFDKVAEGGSSPAPVVLLLSTSTEKSTSSSTSMTSSSSPMETFDPLKLIHSWFIKT